MAIFFSQSEQPLSKPEDVKLLLAEPEKQWAERYSAYETACSWFDANGLPAPIAEILQSDPAFRNARLKKAYFEKQTELDDSNRRPSQTDVLALLQIGNGPAVLGIEGKVNESFGPLVADWNDYSPGKLRRIAALVERLGLKPSTSLGSLRYQLFHRAAATLIEAQRAGAAEAAMIVQSFSPDGVRTGFQDFQNFSIALGTPVEQPGRLSTPIERCGIRLRLGWTVNAFREP